VNDRRGLHGQGGGIGCGAALSVGDHATVVGGIVAVGVGHGHGRRRATGVVAAVAQVHSVLLPLVVQGRSARGVDGEGRVVAREDGLTRRMRRDHGGERPGTDADLLAANRPEPGNALSDHLPLGHVQIGRGGRGHCEIEGVAVAGADLAGHVDPVERGEGIAVAYRSQLETVVAVPQHAAVGERNADIVALAWIHAGGNRVTDVFAGIQVPGRRDTEVVADALVDRPHGQRTEPGVDQEEGVAGTVVMERELDQACRSIGDPDLAEAAGRVGHAAVIPVADAVHVCDHIADIALHGQGQRVAVGLMFRVLHGRIAVGDGAGRTTVVGVRVMGDVDVGVVIVGKQRPSPDIVVEAVRAEVR